MFIPPRWFVKAEHQKGYEKEGNEQATRDEETPK